MDTQAVRDRFHKSDATKAISLTLVPLFADLAVTPAYTLCRSKRRTIAIHVQDGRVEVRAPMRVAQRDIDAFVKEKTPWIVKKLEELRQRDAEFFQIKTGSRITVLGETLTVQWQLASRRAVWREGNSLIIAGRMLDESLAKRLFLKWLAEQAAGQLLPLAEQRVADMGLSHRLRGFSLRYTRSLWGRCSASGNILFNPLILLAPVAVMDYLVVHEASHLRHMNHSPDFWALVAIHCPAWKSSRDWLKKNGHSLRVA